MGLKDLLQQVRTWSDRRVGQLVANVAEFIDDRPLGLTQYGAEGFPPEAVHHVEESSLIPAHLAATGVDAGAFFKDLNLPVPLERAIKPLFHKGNQSLREKLHALEDITSVPASRLIGIPEVIIGKVIKADLMPATCAHRRYDIRLQALADFTQTFAGTGELARRLGCSIKETRRRLRSAGLAPAAVVYKFHLWDRLRAEPAIGLFPTVALRGIRHRTISSTQTVTMA